MQNCAEPTVKTNQKSNEAGLLGVVYQKILDLNARLESSRNRIAEVNDKILGVVEEPETAGSSHLVEGFIGVIDQKLNVAHEFVSDIERQIDRISQLNGPRSF